MSTQDQPHSSQRPAVVGPCGLPHGNYDLLLLPPNSSKAGFVFLPSLHTHTNSFIAGIVATLVATTIWVLVAPVISSSFEHLSKSGARGTILIAIAVGMTCWGFGMLSMNFISYFRMHEIETRRDIYSSSTPTPPDTTTTTTTPRPVRLNNRDYQRPTLSRQNSFRSPNSHSASEDPSSVVFQSRQPMVARNPSVATHRSPGSSPPTFTTTDEFSGGCLTDPKITIHSNGLKFDLQTFKDVATKPEPEPRSSAPTSPSILNSPSKPNSPTLVDRISPVKPISVTQLPTKLNVQHQPKRSTDESEVSTIRSRDSPIEKPTPLSQVVEIKKSVVSTVKAEATAEYRARAQEEAKAKVTAEAQKTERSRARAQAKEDARRREDHRKRSEEARRKKEEAAELEAKAKAEQEKQKARERERLIREARARAEKDRAEAELLARLEKDAQDRAAAKERAAKERATKEMIEREIRLKIERERSEKARLEQESQERGRRERLEEEKRLKQEQDARIDRENLEKERIELEREKSRLEKECLQQQLEHERMERERLEREKHATEQARLERDRKDRERSERERLERQRLEKIKLERDRQRREQERLENDKLQREKELKERVEKEKAEKERLNKLEKERERDRIERIARDRIDRERTEKLARERMEREKIERERIERERERLESAAAGGANPGGPKAAKSTISTPSSSVRRPVYGVGERINMYDRKADSASTAQSPPPPPRHATPPPTPPSRRYHGSQPSMAGSRATRSSQQQPSVVSTAYSSAYSGASSSPSSTGSSSSAATSAPSSPFQDDEPFHTSDPNAIIIKAVYRFDQASSSDIPISQLVAGINGVSDGLVLNMANGGLMVDDMKRKVGQREWDVKTWELARIETGEYSSYFLLRVSLTPPHDSTKLVFVIADTESTKVLASVSRLRQGPLARTLKTQILKLEETKACLASLGWKS